MEFRYGDIVRIKRTGEYGGITDLRYKVIDRMTDGSKDYYLLQDIQGNTLRGWHRPDRLIRVEIDE